MPNLFNRNKSRFRLSPITSSRKLSPTMEAAFNRMVKPGFPRTTPFATTAEVAEYFNHNELTCLRCGKLYKVLTQHITRIHGITSEQYKQMYRLPLHKGLSGKDTRERKSAKAKEKGLGNPQYLTSYGPSPSGPGKRCRSEYNTLRAKEKIEGINKAGLNIHRK